MSFVLIKTSEDLKYLDKELVKKPFVAVDTEFIRTSKKNMRLALIQVRDLEETFIIDCIEVGKYKGECSFLFSSDVSKIFHSCREDLEAIFSWTYSVTNNIFDTQLANEFLGGSFSIGYQDLVFQRLGVKVNKGETRSNWLKRPLRDAQLDYAASDVEFLIDLFLSQKEELKLSKKLDWLLEETSLMGDKLLLIEQGSAVYENRFKKHKFSKPEEKFLKKSLNEIIKMASKEEKINPTMLLSKKNQDIFLNNVIRDGLDNSIQSLSKWRRKILSDKINLLFLGLQA